MIPLTKETIDNIFEPRREIKSHELDTKGVGRLLTDGKGKFYCITRHRAASGWTLLWHTPNRLEPGWTTEWGQRKYKKGTWPTWIQIDVPSAEHLWEVLPQPTHQAELILAFYRLAFPNWDDLVKIDGYPLVSERTWKYIWEKCAAFDKRMHPDVMPGGSWALGAGFSGPHSAEERMIPDWKIDLRPCKVCTASTPFYFTVRESLYGDNNEFSVYYPSIVWDGGLRDSIEAEEGVRRHNTLAEAQAACEKRADCALSWDALIGPVNQWGDRHWQSSIVEPMRKAA